MVPRYQDRLSFFYTFDLNYETHYVHYEPVVRVVTPKGASKTPPRALPEVTSFNVGRDGGKFTVMFHCQKSRQNHTVLFELKVSITNDVNRVLRFYKSCGTGTHPYVHANSTSDGVVKPLLYPPTWISVPATVDTTRVRLAVQSPTLAQAHGKPILMSSNPDVNATLRGLTNSGTVINGIPLNILISYSCPSRGSSIVSLIIPIPPWNSIIGNFKKRCGKTRPYSLQIETVSTDEYVVVQGLTISRFDASKIVSGKWNRNRIPWLHRVDANESETLFTMRNKPFYGEPPLYIQSVMTTVVNSTVATAAVGLKTAFGLKPLQDMPLVPKHSQHLVVKYSCLRKGYTVILVTIQMLQYEMVEFGFTKYCDGGVRSNLISKLHRMEWAVLAVAITGIFLLCCALSRRRASKIKFAKLSST